jgi:ATP-dependent RNA helicase RhlE
MESFRSGKVRVLVATDIAARGIDVADIGHVINFDLPNVPEDYVHRIGRTARAESSGRASSFASPEEHEFLRGIEKLTRRTVPRTEVPRESETFKSEVARRETPHPGARRQGSGHRGSGAGQRATGAGRPAAARGGRWSPRRR